MESVKNRLISNFELILNWVKEKEYRKYALGAGTVFLLAIVLTSGEKAVSYKYYGDKSKKFKNSVVVANPYKNFVQEKLDQIKKTEVDLRKDNRELKKLIEGVRREIKGLSATQAESKKQVENPIEKGVGETVNEGVVSEKPVVVPSEPKGFVKDKASLQKGYKSYKPRGKQSLVFPVSVEGKDEEIGIILGAGSRVVGKVLSGGEVPMGDTYPFLIELDHAFTTANGNKIDLKGCMVTAKSAPVFATGKMKLMPHKISCYNSKKEYFEKKDLKGWFADPLDDNFGMRAEVKTNSAKKALGVFGGALVQGIGASLERNTRSVGGQGIDNLRPNVVIQDGVSQAGQKVMQLQQEYLNALKPVQKLNSGRDTWLILLDSITIPHGFITSEKEGDDEIVSSNSSFVQ